MLINIEKLIHLILLFGQLMISHDYSSYYSFDDQGDQNELNKWKAKMLIDLL